MKKSQFKIRLRNGEYKQVDGYIFKFSYYDCEDIFYVGIHKIGSKWILTDLYSGERFGVWSATKKDCVFWLGKKMFKCNRYTMLNLINQFSDNKFNADAISSLSRCKVDYYYPANNTEMKYIIKNHWADDTSAIIGVGLRPYYVNFKSFKGD